MAVAAAEALAQPDALPVEATVAVLRSETEAQLEAEFKRLPEALPLLLPQEDADGAPRVQLGSAVPVAAPGLWELRAVAVAPHPGDRVSPRLSLAVAQPLALCDGHCDALLVTLALTQPLELPALGEREVKGDREELLLPLEHPLCELTGVVDTLTLAQRDAGADAEGADAVGGTEGVALELLLIDAVPAAGEGDVLPQDDAEAARGGEAVADEERDEEEEELTQELALPLAEAAELPEAPCDSDVETKGLDDENPLPVPREGVVDRVGTALPVTAEADTEAEGQELAVAMDAVAELEVLAL